MTTSACPRCHDEVTLPPGAPRGAQVRCPWCREEFELSELLDRMPPMLEIVNSPYIGSEERREFPSDATADADFRIADDNGRSAPGAFDFSSSGAAATAAPTVAPRPRTAKPGTATRPRRKEKSAVAEIAKVVLGGVFGLAMGQLILWWLPGEWSRDPIELGPKVGEYAPWIVPARYRPRSSSAGGAIDDGSSRTPESAAGGEPFAGAGNASRPRDTSGGGRNRPSGARPAGAATTLPPLTSEPLVEEEPLASPTTSTGNQGAGAPADPLELPEPDLSLTPGDNLALEPRTPTPSKITPTDSVEITAEPPAPAEPAPALTPAESAATVEPTPPAPETSTPEPAADAFIGVTDAPMYVRDEVDASLAEARAAQEAVQSAEASAAPEAEQQFYTALTELAERITYSDLNDPKIDEAAQEAKNLLAQGNLRERAKLLIAHGPARLAAKKEDRPNNGVVLFGKVQEVEKSGVLYETRLEAPSSGGTAVIPVFSKHDPNLNPNAMIIVLGTLVDQPKKRLAGYDGGLPTVVWMSHAATLTQ